MISDLRRHEPVLKKPEELTDDIMEAIMAKKAPVTAMSNHSRRSRTLVLASRLLAVASVCLFLIFGYEQYVVVDKIGKLESQNATISQNSKYKTALRINNVISLVRSDPEWMNYYNEYSRNEPAKLRLVKAAFLIEMATFSGKEPTNKVPQK